MSRTCWTIFSVVVISFVAFTAGYAGTSSKADLPIANKLFSDPIPSITSWIDRSKIISAGGLEPDAIVILASNPEDKKLALNIHKKTNRGPCFGTLRETERLYGGYVVHFDADPVDRQCKDTVDHAFLIPSYYYPDAKFYLNLYDGPVYKGQVPIKLSKVGKKATIPDSDKAKLKRIYYEIENEMASLHRAKKCMIL